MPVGLKDAQPSRFDGPPRLVCLGFQLANGKLIGPRDMFDDPAFDEARRQANEMAYYLRRHGPFEPHRLGPEEMEYTTLPKILNEMKDKFVSEQGARRNTYKEMRKELENKRKKVMEEQKKLLENKNYGGTMRLGAYPAYLKKGTIARGAYKAEMVSERHRHRYEVNNAYVEKLEKAV